MSDLSLRKKKKVKKRELKRYLSRKYAFDKAFSLTALTVLSPLMLAIAIGIYIDDPHGNPFYSQIRVGENGRPFRLYKFRTMYKGAEDEMENLIPRNEMKGPAFKIKDDSRITKAGKFLRKSGLDEIPQFINVLKGDMSIVGPRPALPREARQYNEYQKKRLKVRPGITCYWQIQPARNSMLFDDWVALDLKYIKERSVAVDGKIMRETIKAMSRMQGE